ncbi:hypothetical protein [Nonomuraea salmonea]|uniref:hypothetical protein n=1 Tax=Nonomuraea salmonea TaxID=46181 RepID=UPI002FEB8D5E
MTRSACSEPIAAARTPTPRPDEPDEQQVDRLHRGDGAEPALLRQLRQLLGDVGERAEVGLAGLQHAAEGRVGLGHEVERAARGHDLAALDADGRAHRGGGRVVRDKRGGAARGMFEEQRERLGVGHQVGGQHGHRARGGADDLGDAAQVGREAAARAHHLHLADGQGGELVVEPVEQGAVAAEKPAGGRRGEQHDRRGRAFAGQ